MPHQVKGNSLLSQSQWMNLSFEELVYNLYLYQQIPVRQLLMMEFVLISKHDPAMAIQNMTIFWNHSLSNNSVSDGNNSVSDYRSGHYRNWSGGGGWWGKQHQLHKQSVHPNLKINQP
jgi:hypothetical protein